MNKKQYRAKMRAEYGADWWKDNPTPKWDVKGYRKEWQGFPRYVGGLRYSSLDEPDYAKPGDDLIYSGEIGSSRIHGAQPLQGIRVEKTWGRWGDAFHVIEWQAIGSHHSYTGRILTGASREKTIRYLKSLKDYYGPDEKQP